jgi:hypothetical protein
MDRITNFIGSGKKQLLPVIAYYFVLLLIAMSWTERALIEPSTVFRLLFVVLFSLPLFKYRYLAPAVLAVFTAIRLFSVSPYGYLPSDAKFYFYLTLLIFFIEIVPHIYAGRINLFFKGSSKGLIALLFIALISNLVNLSADYSFVFLLGSVFILTRFVRSRDNIEMLEIAFMVVTFCLSIYAFIFSADFAIKQYVNKDIIQRAYWTDPNYLGSVLTVGIVISFYYFINRTRDKIIFRISYLVISIMGFIVLGLLASRGAFIAAIAPALYILYKKTNSVKNLVFVVLFVGITFVAFSNTEYFSSLFARFDSGDTTGSSRTIIWELSINKFFQSDMPMLLLGGGTNYSDLLVGKSLGMARYSTHNNFLAILYDYGIIGLLLFISMFYSWLRRNSHNVLLVSLIIYFGIVCFTLVPLMYHSYGYLIVLFESYSLVSKPRPA